VCTNDWRLHTHTTNCTDLAIFRRVANLMVNLTLRDLTRADLCELPPITRLHASETTHRLLLWRVHTLTTVTTMQVLLVFPQQWSKHVLIIVVRWSTVASVSITIRSIRLELLVSILLADACLFTFQLYLLMSLFFNHIVSSLVKAHASLCLHLLLNQAT
jgi:hypothetical protein